jgi:ribonucleotide reductase class II
MNYISNIEKNDDYVVPNGMSKEVFIDKYSRKKEDGSYQTWKERINEVVEGNFTLDRRDINDTSLIIDKALTHDLGRKGIYVLSGRHLQHGDLDQKNKIGELFTNCSTAMFSWVQFWLLMKGSGVGRSYDSDVHFVDWDYMPNCRFVLSSNHPDYEPWVESLESAQHKYDTESEDVRWFEVDDSAEGWTKIITVTETAAFHKNNKDTTFVFDLTKIRERNKPIRGQQNRPASGPIPLIQALYEITRIKGLGWKPWKQALFIDHYLSACVLVGGVRRSARMSTKYWKDRDIFEFIDIKRGGWLYTSNNSIMVDEEFWQQARSPKPSHARRVFEAAIAAGYWDRTGEPGFINVDKLTWNREGMELITSDTYLGKTITSKMFGNFHKRTVEMTEYILERAKNKKYCWIVNPCVTADTWVMTSEGPKQVIDLIENPFKAIVNGKSFKSNGFFKTDENRNILKVKTSRGYELKVTGNHKVLVEISKKQKLNGGYNIKTKWVEAELLQEGDKIVLNNVGNIKWDGDGSYKEGWLLGSMIGDGGHNPKKYHSYVRFWGENKKYLADYAMDKMKRCDNFKERSGFKGVNNSCGDTITVANKTLTEIGINYLVKGKNIDSCLENNSSNFYRGFIRGFFDADGTVLVNQQKGNSVRLANNNLHNLKTIQRMLLRLGIACSIYKNRKPEGKYYLPDGKGGQKLYKCQKMYELCIGRKNILRFYERIGFADPDKQDKLLTIINSIKIWYEDSFTTKVTKIKKLKAKEDVYDCTVETIHRFDANGMIVHNCGEIVEAIYGAYCVVGDTCLAYAKNKQEALDGVRMVCQSLIRTNLMDFLYAEETARTNRIGVSLIGLHEFMWNIFGVSFDEAVLFDDMYRKSSSIELNTDQFKRVSAFWNFIEEMQKTVEQEAIWISEIFGVKVPHTFICMKPGGTTPKVMNCTEAASLPSMPYYLRWVQFRGDHIALEEYKRRGYPIRDISNSEVRIDDEGNKFTVNGYKDTYIVGFPTRMEIAGLMGDRLITAAEATFEQYYAWLRLLEKYLLGGPGKNNQISITMKYDPKKLSYNDFINVMLNQQSTIRCCAFMPQEDKSAYIYTPEERITEDEYNRLISQIDLAEREAVDTNSLDCEGGACGIDGNRNASIIDELENAA